MSLYKAYPNHVEIAKVLRVLAPWLSAPQCVKCQWKAHDVHGSQFSSEVMARNEDKSAASSPYPSMEICQ